MVETAPTTAPAVLPDVPAVEDKLNFAPYARTLLDIILNPDTETPLTIGIFGSWGSGKTSLMKMIEAGLQSASREEQTGRQTFPIWFNAWLYSKEDTLWRALIMQVLTGLGRIPDLGTEARTELTALADQLYRAAGPSELGTLSLTAADLLKDEDTGSAQITLAMQHGLDFLQNIAEARQQGELAAVQSLRDQVRRATADLERERIESLEQFQTQFKDLIDKHILRRGYLVIFVDDLDRCLPDKAVEVLEAIKLFLDVPGCVFILGIDREVVERGIRLRYGEMGGQGDRDALQLHVDSEGLDKGAARYRTFLQEFYTDADDVIDGGRYLEKIIQIPFVLPPISPQAMGRFVAQLTPNLPDPRCGLVFVRGLEPNPRQVKRALNIFALLWALAQNQPYLADRVSPVRLAKLVVLQQRHGDLYEQLRQDPSRLIAWERTFRVRRDRAKYQEWAQTTSIDWQSAGSLWSLEAPFPAELEAYEELPALEQLLTMHPLAGDTAKSANFVDMTPEQVYDLIFLAHTAEGGIERQKEEPKAQVVETMVEVDLDSTDVIPLHDMLRLSEEEVGFIAQRALGEAGRMALALGQGQRPSEEMIEQLANTGLNLYSGLLGNYYRGTDFAALLAREEGRTIQLLFEGIEAPAMARLPWEIVYDRDKDPSFEKIILKDFWGGRHIIHRPLIPRALQLKLPPTPPTTFGEDLPLRVGLVLDWGKDAGPAMELFNTLQDTGQIGVRPIEDVQDLYQSITEDPADLYVFYGRGWQEMGEGVIGIGKGFPLRAREMLGKTVKDRFAFTAQKTAQAFKSRLDMPQEIASFARRPLFYFCLDGDASQEIDWSAWLSVLAQLGAGGAIVPLIYTPGAWPLGLVSIFLDYLLAGDPLGTALRHARNALFEQDGNPLGLLYVYFGPPELRWAAQAEEDDTDTDEEKD